MSGFHTQKFSLSPAFIEKSSASIGTWNVSVTLVTLTLLVISIVYLVQKRLIFIIEAVVLFYTLLDAMFLAVIEDCLKNSRSDLKLPAVELSKQSVLSSFDQNASEYNQTSSMQSEASPPNTDHSCRTLPNSHDRSLIRNKKSSASAAIKKLRFSLDFELETNDCDSSVSSNSHNDQSLETFESAEVPDSPERVFTFDDIRTHSPEYLPFADDEEDNDGYLSQYPLTPPAARRLLASSSPDELASELHLADMNECDNLSFDENFFAADAEECPDAVSSENNAVADREVESRDDSDLADFLSLLRQDSMQSHVALTS